MEFFLLLFLFVLIVPYILCSKEESCKNCKGEGCCICGPGASI